MKNILLAGFGIIILVILSLSYCGTRNNSSRNVLKVGYFPNITHGQALIGHSTGRFQKKFGDKVSIEWKVFNSGSSVVEAIFADELDIAYTGPNPAITGYIRSKGEALRILAGSSSGGAGLVVRKNAGIKSVQDINGKTLATPSYGNSQDIALKHWLKTHDYRLKEAGGNVHVIPVDNPDQLTLFMKGEIDGAWTVEPWLSRLIVEGNGELFLDERELWPEGKYVTTHLVVNTKFLKHNPELVKEFVSEHVAITLWINENLTEAKKTVNRQIEKNTGKAIPEIILEPAFSGIEFTYDPIAFSLYESAEAAYTLGFFSKKPELQNIYYLDLLNSVLSEEKLPGVSSNLPVPGGKDNARN